MKIKVNQPDYGPSDWDIDFDFDLDLSLSDYLFLGLYLIFAVPILFILEGMHFLFRKTSDLFHVSEKTPGKGSGVCSLISKIF